MSHDVERLVQAVSDLTKSNAALTETNRELTHKLGDQLDAVELRDECAALRERAEEAEQGLRHALAEKANLEQQMMLSSAQQAAKRQDEFIETLSKVTAGSIMGPGLIIHYLALFDVGGTWFAVGPMYAAMWIGIFLSSMGSREQRVFDVRLKVAHTLNSWWFQILMWLPGTIISLDPSGVCSAAHAAIPGRCETAFAFCVAQVVSVASYVVIVRAVRRKPGSVGPAWSPFLSITTSMRQTVASDDAFSSGAYNRRKLKTEPAYAWAAIHHERNNFAVPARLALRSMHQAYRMQLAIECTVVSAALAGLLILKWESLPEVERTHCVALIGLTTIGLGLGLALTSERVRSAYAGLLSRQALKGDAVRAAGVAALIGKQDIRSVLAIARRSFTGVALRQLEFSHLAASTADTSCSHLAVRYQLGEIDAFFSHSWHDDPQLKWRTLQRWGRGFEKESGGRPPILWFDRCCIDQAGDIDAQLTALPVFLAGCRSMLVVLGPTYTRRLWCIIEIFTFLTAGRTVDSLQILPIGSSESMAAAGHSGASELPASVAPSASDGGDDEEMAAGSSQWVERALRSFREFEVGACLCSNEEHRQHLLGVIETGFGSFGTFNSLVRHLLTGEKVAKQISNDSMQAWKPLVVGNSSTSRLPTRATPSARVLPHSGKGH